MDQPDFSAAILSVGTALPPHYADQEQIIAALRKLWSREHFNLERIEEMHRAVQVGGRYLALPVDDYEGMVTFAQRNAAWTQAAVDIGERAIHAALKKADLKVTDVDHLFFVTVTGIATPSIDARLVNRMGFRTDIKRTPIFGLGCVAGAAGTARAVDYLKGHPNEVAVVLSVELCSLTLQREDLSIPNIIATGLFGDGAAAVVLGGAARASASGPKVLATRSVFYKDTERIMGWDVVDGGFKIVLSAKVPALVREHIRGDVDSFLGSQRLRRQDIRHWVAHTGGPKVLDAFQAALELPPDALARSWSSLKETGNLSSASVLFVLNDLMTSGTTASKEHGLLLAMGPGFCSELVLFQC